MVLTFRRTKLVNYNEVVIIMFLNYHKSGLANCNLLLSRYLETGASFIAKCRNTLSIVKSQVELINY